MPTIAVLVIQHGALALHTLRTGQGRILSSNRRGTLSKSLLILRLAAKRTSVPGPLRTSVPVLLEEVLPKRRTAANLAGFGVDCLLSPGGCSPGRALKMTNRLYILWSNILIIGIFGRDYGGITITAGPIRSRKHTPTQDLGSPLLDHFISRHMHRERIRPSTASPHIDGTSRGGGWTSRKYHSRPAFKILPKQGSPPRASSSVNSCRRQVSGVLFPSLPNGTLTDLCNLPP